MAYEGLVTNLSKIKDISFKMNIRLIDLATRNYCTTYLQQPITLKYFLDMALVIEH